MNESPAVATIGKFDGVHRGHAALLHHLVERARALNLVSLVVTFDPHPLRVLRPDLPIVTLTDPDERARLIRAMGVDDVWLCPFTTELAHLAPEQFISTIERRHPLVELWVGPDFALGRNRAGTRDVLEQIGRERGFSVHTMPTVREPDGEPVRSSRVHQALQAGDVAEAARLLARPYRLSGVFEQHGTGWDFQPTPGRHVPAAGCYAATLSAAGQTRSVRVEIPAVPGGPLTVDGAGLVACAARGPAALDFQSAAPCGPGSADGE